MRVLIAMMPSHDCDHIHNRYTYSIVILRFDAVRNAHNAHCHWLAARGEGPSSTCWPRPAPAVPPLAAGGARGRRKRRPDCRSALYNLLRTGRGRWSWAPATQLQPTELSSESPTGSTPTREQTPKRHNWITRWHGMPGPNSTLICRAELGWVGVYVATEQQ
mgnify:CR=1 FL=1